MREDTHTGPAMELSQQRSEPIWKVDVKAAYVVNDLCAFDLDNLGLDKEQKATLASILV